jgi:hypothetical protein
MQIQGKYGYHFISQQVSSKFPKKTAQNSLAGRHFIPRGKAGA